jgi:Xaa-Pro dipeptidase
MADVESVLAGKYPAKAHARRVVEYIRKTNPNASGTLYLEGQKTCMIEDNDETQPFRYDLTALDYSKANQPLDSGDSSTT